MVAATSDIPKTSDVKSCIEHVMFRVPPPGLIQQVKTKASVLVHGDPTKMTSNLPVLGAALNDLGYCFNLITGDKRRLEKMFHKQLAEEHRIAQKDLPTAKRTQFSK